MFILEEILMGPSLKKTTSIEKIRKACNLTKKKHKLIIAGDFNAITSIVLTNSFYDGTGVVEDTQCNDNGARLKSFCRSKSLCMLQTYFNSPLSKRHTWYSNDGNTNRVLDYVLTETFVQQYVTSCAVEDSFDFENDHKLSVTNLLTPKTKRARWRARTLREQQGDVSALEETRTHNEFVQNVENQIPITHEGDTVDQRSERIIEVLKRSASISLPRNTAKSTREIWKDGIELNLAVCERSNLARRLNEYKEI